MICRCEDRLSIKIYDIVCHKHWSVFINRIIHNYDITSFDPSSFKRNCSQAIQFKVEGDDLHFIGNERWPL